MTALGDLLGWAWAVLLATGLYAGFGRRSLPWMQGLFAAANWSAALAFLLYGLWAQAAPFAVFAATLTWVCWYGTRPAKVKGEPPRVPPSTDDQGWLSRPYADPDACWGCGMDPELTDAEKEEAARRGGPATRVCEWCKELAEAADPSIEWWESDPAEAAR